MLTTRLPDALRELGFTDSEVAHALRPGGPLDDITHRTWCDNCNRSIERTLRELLASNAHCSCGGMFHVGGNRRDIVDEIAGKLVPNATPARFEIPPPGARRAS